MESGRGGGPGLPSLGPVLVFLSVTQQKDEIFVPLIPQFIVTSEVISRAPSVLKNHKLLREYAPGAEVATSLGRGGMENSGWSCRLCH